MAYVEPQTRSQGVLIGPGIWNQDVVDNVIAIRALLVLTFIRSISGRRR